MVVAVAPFSRKNQAAVEDAVRRVEAAYAPDVVRIKHYFSDDSMGYPSIYFLLVVRDELAFSERFLTLANGVRKALDNETEAYEFGLSTHFRFRTVSEQLELKDPAWE